MPFQLKGGARRKSGTKSKGKKKRLTHKSVAKVAKNVLFKHSETKVGNFAAENQQLYHNTWVIPDTNACFTQQGIQDEEDVSANNRIGNAIQPIKLWWRIHLFNKLDRPNLYYRVVVVRRATNQSGGILSIPSGHPESVYFPGVLGNQMILPFNREQCTPVYDKLHRVTNPGGYTGDVALDDREIQKIIDVNIDLRKITQMTYLQGGSVPKNYVYQLLILAYDAFGTLTTDNVGSYAFVRRFYYKDI